MSNLFSPTPEVIWRMIHSTCVAGVDFVYDVTFSRELSLLESCREFVARYTRKDSDKSALPMLASACPGMCPIDPPICKVKSQIHKQIMKFCTERTFPRLQKDEWKAGTRFASFVGRANRSAFCYVVIAVIVVEQPPPAKTAFSSNQALHQWCDGLKR